MTKMKVLKFDDSLSAAYSTPETKTYLYRDRDTGELVGVRMGLGEKLAREKTGGFLDAPDGRELVRAFREELQRDGLADKPKTVVRQQAQWPMVSINGGVNPDQIGELREIWREHRVTGCDVLPNGDVVYESRAARKADHEARGLFDKDGGYGDAMPQNL